MRVAYVQTYPAFGRVKENVERAVELVKSTGADLVVLPELYSTGYRFRTKAEAVKLSEKAGDGPATGRLVETARDLGIHIAAGFCENYRGRAYNSALVVGPGGIVGVYRKAHLFWNEQKIFTPGKTPFPVYDAGGVKLGLMICYDWIFPEAARTLALKGAEVICHPSNLVLPNCPQAMITRCLENRVFAVTANRVGTEKRMRGKPLRFIGQSQVVSPRGEVLKRAGEEKEEVGVVEIDPRKATDKYVTPVNDVFSDRREDLYEL